ncbi:RING-type E3 ubiquitin transferase [Trifolium repens]|nr:RING-type E3 ubiquitin transferase [Trifolium repens]
MATSGVEIASSAPFDCVLRDRNHRDVCRESSKVKATHVAFQRNIKNFVMDHLNTCISMSDSSTTNENNINNNNNDSQMNNNKLARIRLTRNNHNNNDKGDKDELALASMISPKHSRLLDRWAARQAREMVSTLENEAELLSIEENTHKSNNIPISSETSSSISDECSSEISNLGASSLVQIWEKRLNKSSGSKPSTPMEKTSPNDGTSAATCNNENEFVVEEQRGPELGLCFEGQLSGNEESFSISSFPDWESDKTGDQSRSCSRDQSRWCSSESDRVSVAEIIKKLTATSQTQSPPPYFADENDHEVSGSSTRECSPCRDFVPELPDQRVFPQVTCLPRIRGRQAFNDLLMQLENDRHGELKNLAERGTVSKFAQRGRIQALLRLKLLQRGVAANNLLQKSTSSEVNRQVQPQGSAIMQLREKFSTAVEQKSTVQTEVANAQNTRKEIVNNITQLENSSIAAQISKDTSSQVPHGTASHSFKSTQKSVSQTRDEDGPSSNAVSQETCFKAQHDYFKETAEPTTSMNDSNANEKAEEENNQQYDETSYGCALEEEGSNQNYGESSYEEEVEEIYDENNHDWISEISRPKSFWEEKRQAWYKEMLDNGSPNEDIQVLLQRRTVSTFLSSDFREKMDRLMQSHKGTQTHLVSNCDDDEDNEGLMAFFLERLHSARTPQENGIERTVDEEKESINEEEENEEEDEEEEDEDDDDDDEKEHEEELGGESLVSSLYHEVGDYSNRSSSWNYRDNETGDDFDRVASTSSRPYQSPSFYHDSRRTSPSTNQHSIEMDLIYDMRGYMEQLHQEMTELRKSIKSCLDMQMQMQLQQSNNQRMQTVEKEEKKSHNKAGKKGNCCICYKMKVDSVLYRCGHMCACLKCANELQWNSGKCPICQAKIDDVVRVYVDA